MSMFNLEVKETHFFINHKWILYVNIEGESITNKILALVAIGAILILNLSNLSFYIPYFVKQVGR